MSFRVTVPKHLSELALTLSRSPGLALADQVYERLRSDILQVLFRPGEALSENALARGLGVSRTPVRESIRCLVREGLVQVLPQRGTSVALLNMQCIHEAVFVLEAVETQAVRQIVKTPENPDGMRALMSCIDRQSAALAADDLEAAMNADDSFHGTLLALCGMAGAWAVPAPARAMQRRLWAIALPELGAGAQAIEDHQAIVEAIRARDVDLAQERVATHLKRIALLTRRIANLHPDYFEVDDRVNPAF